MQLVRHDDVVSGCLPRGETRAKHGPAQPAEEGELHINFDQPRSTGGMSVSLMAIPGTPMSLYAREILLHRIERNDLPS